MKTLIGACAALLVGGAASAQVSAVNVETSNSPVGVVNDISIDFAGQYTGSQLLVNLTSGSIYQDALGSALPPNPGFIAVFPNLAFDTFVAQGSLTAGSDAGEPAPGGGAVNLGGAATAVFTANAINQAWNPSGGQTGTTDRSGFYTARITLSPDANGTASYLASAAGEITQVEYQIVNGVLVPEPATAALLGLGGLAMLRRRVA